MQTNENSTRRTVAHEWPLPRKVAHAIEPLIKAALDAGRNTRPGWTHRSDGWTPRRIRNFLLVLSQSGVAADAARAAGLSVRSAYALRTKARGQAFDLAWQAAAASARRRATDRFMSRRHFERVKPIIRNGKLWGEVHREDNRGAMSALKRLDRMAASMPREDPAVQFAAENFDAFVEFVCATSGSASNFTPGNDSPSEAPCEPHRASTS